LYGVPGHVKPENATEEANPSMIPKAVHICHIMVKAPRIVFGADSAE